jgi:hypothetical protein
MKSTPTSSTSKCYYDLRLLQVSKLKKRRPHSIFYLTHYALFHLAHSDEDPNNQQRKRLRTSHRSTKVEDRLPTLGAMFLFISLLLAPFFFESRDEIPFKGIYTPTFLLGSNITRYKCPHLYWALSGSSTNVLFISHHNKKHINVIFIVFSLICCNA